MQVKHKLESEEFLEGVSFYALEWPFWRGSLIADW